MGSIANRLRKKVSEFRADQQERNWRNAQTKTKEKEAYNQAYESGRIVRARKEGYRKGSQGSSFGRRAVRVAEGFGRTADLMFPEFSSHRRPPQRRTGGGKAVHVYVHTGAKPKSHSHHAHRKKRDSYSW